MTTPFNRYVKEKIVAKNKEKKEKGKEEEEENKEKIRVNPEDSETKEDIKPSSQDVQPTEEREKRDIGELVKLSLKDLRKIEEKMKNGTNLDEQDIRTLYANILNPKTIFDKKDLMKKMKKLQKEREFGGKIKDDLACILNTTTDHISVTKKRALSGDIVCHYGDLDLRELTIAADLKLPEIVVGDLDLGKLTTTEGLNFPDIITGGLILERLKTAEGLKLPEHVGNYLDLKHLTDAEDLKFPETVGGNLILRKLRIVEDVELPDIVDGYLDISGLTTLAGITRWPSHINIILYISASASLPKKSRVFLKKKYPGKVERWY